MMNPSRLHYAALLSHVSLPLEPLFLVPSYFQVLFFYVCHTEFNWNFLPRHGWKSMYWSKDSLSVAILLSKMVQPLQTIVTVNNP